MLRIEFSPRLFMASAVGGVLIMSLQLAACLLMGVAFTPLVIATLFLTSFAAAFGAITLLVNLAISRMDLIDNVNTSADVAHLMVLERQQRWERQQAFVPRQNVAHFIQREIEAGNPMWDFMKPKSSAPQKPNDPNVIPDEDCYRVGGHNLRKRKK